MKSHDINQKYCELLKNVEYLEQEGKTVVVLVIDKVPQLIVALEEAHLAKEDSKYVVKYLQTELNMRVCMITGDN